MTKPYDMSGETPCCEHECSVCGRLIQCYDECRVAHQLDSGHEIICAVCTVDEE